MGVSKMTKKTIIIFSVLLAAAGFSPSAGMPGPSPPRDPPGGASEDCPAGWFQTTEGCYLFLDSEKATWFEAQLSCEREGGFLAEPRTEEEMLVLADAAFVYQGILEADS